MNRSHLSQLLFGCTVCVALIMSSMSACSARVACGENHKSVSMMRSQTHEQLANLNARMLELGAQHPDETFYRHREPLIPDDLKYLKAGYISLRGTGATVVLAKCDVSEGIVLHFETSIDGQRRIKLEWFAPTSENPYMTNSEILWSSAS